MSQSDIKEKIRIDVRQDLAEPPRFGVIYVNDNQTSFDFVIGTLIEIFDYSADSAIKTAEEVHEQGSRVVAVLPFEIAEQKSLEVLTLAKLAGFPLEVRVEAQ